MTHEYSLRRGHDKSLRAKTELCLDDAKRRYLSVETSKHPRGGLSTTASVFHLSADGIGQVHEIGFGLPGAGDFWRTVEHEPQARCTERNVRAIHERALERLETIKTMACGHYAAKDATPA